MKIFLIAAIACVSVSLINCSSQKKALTSDCYKGRLEIKGICSNYTIKLLEGKIDTAKIAAAWIDETTGKAYTNVFALGSPCTFAATINAGDEFYFTIDTSAPQNCAVCMAFYPHPQRAVKIKVLNGPCN
ncbi:MAG: hypothetical protein JWR72_418 [Flavisolibacter sp.]|nr:hypothetical protein [Flavisolibacter sp.]